MTNVPELSKESLSIQQFITRTLQKCSKKDKNRHTKNRKKTKIDKNAKTEEKDGKDTEKTLIHSTTIFHFAGRRARTAATMKDSLRGQLKLSPIITKRPPKFTQAAHSPNTSASVNYEKSLEITRRTRNVRNRLQQIQKQFDNHAITKFFQRTLKAGHGIGLDVDMADENACDGFNGAGGSRGSTPEQSDDAHYEAAADPCQAGAGVATELSACSPSTNDYRHSIQPENIFLQKPVLRLDIVEQSLTHAAAIVMDKPSQSFATSTPFDGRPEFGAARPAHSLMAESVGQTLAVGQYDDQLQPSDHSDLIGSDRSDASDGSSEKASGLRKPRKCGKRRSDSGFSDDSNSCDSGVVSDKSTEFGGADQNKPTTPHRIVCTSNAPADAKQKLSQSAGNGSAAKRTRGRAIRNWYGLPHFRQMFTSVDIFS